MAFFKSLLFSNLFFFFISLQLFMVQSVQFEVGEDKGWAIPPSKNAQFYNDWAAKHRFQVSDTVHFKYSKDSVLAVTEQEYEKCRSAHPIFFSNNGDTEFKFDHPGLYYFISGVSGHCDRGLKMIVKVLDPEILSPPPSGSNDTSPPGDDSHHKKSAAVQNNAMKLVEVIVLSAFGFLFA